MSATTELPNSHDAENDADLLTLPDTGDKLDLGDHCSSCGAPGLAIGSWCRQCGFYPTLGTHVDIASWESDFENGEYVGPAEEPVSVSQIVRIVLPLVVSIVGVTAITVIARLATEAGSLDRVKLALGEYALGALAFLGAHAYVTYRALKDENDFELLDAITSPMKIWCATLTGLPRTMTRITVAMSGVWAIILAHALLGIPYSQLFGGEVPERKKKETRAMIPAEVANTNSAENKTLEEALNDFADQAAVKPEEEGDGSAGDLPVDPDEEGELQQLNCYIIGYRLDADAHLSLVVAARIGRVLRVVGAVSSGVTPEVQGQVLPRLRNIHRAEPSVRTDLKANWVDPELRCQIEAEYLEQQQRFRNLTLLQLL